MAFTACAVMTTTPQTIQPNTWTLLRYDDVLRNDANMFRGNGLADPDSALIHPDEHAYYLWARFVHWAAISGDPDELAGVQFLEQFARDPYASSPDTTGTTDARGTAGKEFNLATWPFVGDPGTPVGVRVMHNHTAPVNVILAEFKAIKLEV
jgi:hypothetical protein